MKAYGIPSVLFNSSIDIVRRTVTKSKSGEPVVGYGVVLKSGVLAFVEPEMHRQVDLEGKERFVRRFLVAFNYPGFVPTLTDFVKIENVYCEIKSVDNHLNSNVAIDLVCEEVG